MTDGERYIRQQLDAMEATGMGDRVTSPPLPRTRRTIAARARSTAGPGPREWWRIVIAAMLVVGGIAMWFAGHHRSLPQVHVDHLGFVNGEAAARAGWQRIYLEAIGVGTVLAGLVWSWNQLRPKQRTYRRRDVVHAWVIGALMVVGVVLWFFANLGPDLHPFSLLIVLLVVTQSMFITRLTGPDGSRYPLHDPRGDVIRFLTPWPVMLALSVAWCGYQASLLLG